MNRVLIFNLKAERDLIDIQDYYNKILPTITGKFFVAFFRTMDFIEGEPELFQVRYRGIRIAPLQLSGSSLKKIF